MKRPSKSDRERIKHTRNDASGIDKLNPNLRSIENFNGQKRVREFYAMSPEDAYSILAAIAEIHGCEDKLTLVPLSKEQVEAENTAEDIQEQKKERLAPFSFSLCQIPVGATVEYCNRGDASFKYGEGERIVGERHFSYYNEYDLDFLSSLGLIEYWVSEDVRPDRSGEKWLNTLWRK